MNIELIAISGMPEVKAGDDLGAAICDALASGMTDTAPLRDGDIVMVAQKVVSKAEGRGVALSAIVPSADAVELARRTGKDPRLVEAILNESVEVLRAAPGVLIVETRHGFVCANAGIDRSNVPGDDTLLLLPADPDTSARALRQTLHERFAAEIGVILTDSFGRAWRTGQQDVAIGCAGVRPLVDLRGSSDRHDRELTASIDAVADALATAANLARGKRSGEPVVLVRGRADLVTSEDGPGVIPLLRERPLDLFR
jgi:coenzyme F420-0:L-glutamate ligase/coenzyme F420-1:gamma-L-glutamate ligase